GLHHLRPSCGSRKERSHDVTEGWPLPHGCKPKVLFICHNHPAVRPGGAEAYALELHRHLRGSGELESTFLAKGGPPLSLAGRPHVGTYVSLVNGTPAEYFLYTDGYDYDWTFG